MKIIDFRCEKFVKWKTGFFKSVYDVATKIGSCKYYSFYNISNKQFE